MSCTTMSDRSSMLNFVSPALQCWNHPPMVLSVKRKRASEAVTGKPTKRAKPVPTPIAEKPVKPAPNVKTNKAKQKKLFDLFR